jgi:crotonobetainyl-CoA:carnitine CoA-transferase CaiB-like acyl-CoA transferase
MSALEGVRVLDLSTGIAGPVVGMILGDYGADVIRVDGPEGDPQAEHPGYAVWNRNKRGVFVDPRVADDRAWLATSVARADVVILGDGANLDDWGAEVQEAGARNRRLVLLRLPAYTDGHSGWSGGESNLLLAGLGGQAMRQCSVSGGPIATMSPFLSFVHGLWAATSTIAALIERASSGSGQVVTVTGVQALMLAMIQPVNTSPAAPDPVTTVGPMGRHPTYRQFACADGEWITVGAIGQKFETELLRVIGVADEILGDPRIGGVSSRMVEPDNFGWTTRIIESAISRWARPDLMDALRRHNVPFGAMQSREEWFDSEQIRAIGMRIDLDDPARGRVSMPGLPIALTATPGAVARPAPAPGRYDDVEPWPARPQDDSAPERPVRSVPGPLHGVRVLSIGTFVAAPYGGFLLSELGADVIKVEPVTGDPFRDAGGYTYNRGMRSVALDLATPEGQETLRTLARTSEVVMDGMRPGVTRKLNIDYDQLVKVNPAIITQSLSAYGEGGPLSALPGVDMVIQSESGMMSSWGGADSPVANTLAINDVTTAAMNALAVVLAVYRRRTGGEGQRVWNSLAATSVFLQMDQMVRYAGRPPAPLGHRDLRGLHPLSSYYAASDGWIGIDVPISHRTDAVERLRAAGMVHGDDIGAALEVAIAAGTVDAALHRLEGAGIPCTTARLVSHVLQDALLLEEEAFHIRTADDGSTFMQTGRYAGFSRTSRRGPLTPPGAGEHTRDVLAAAGLSDTEIGGLLEAGIAHQGTRVAHIVPVPYR